MLPDRVSNPRPLAQESDALPTALRDPAYENGENPNKMFPQNRKIEY